jgi:hypothetical protein
MKWERWDKWDGWPDLGNLRYLIQCSRKPCLSGFEKVETIPQVRSLYGLNG